MAVLPFEEEIILENERVILRPLTINDHRELLRFSLDEPTLWTYSLVPANGVDNLNKYLDIAFSKKAQKDSYPFIVYDKKFNQYAGSTRFYDYKVQHKTVQLGYTWFGKDFQGTGLNKNCKFLMLEYAFETLNLERVEFRADNNNMRSIAAMLSIGCTKEGVLRNHSASPSGRRDSIILSILKHEWYDSVKENITQKLLKYE